MTRTKQEIRDELERMAQQFQGETKTYAGQQTPTRAPWRKRPSRSELVFAEELQRIVQTRVGYELQPLDIE